MRETTSQTAGREYDRNLDWYAVQLAIDGTGFEVKLYMNGILVEPVYMADYERFEGVLQLQNSDAPNKAIAPPEYEFAFSLNRGTNALKVDYRKISSSPESSFIVKVNAGKMFDNRLWKLKDITNPPLDQGIIVFEFHLPDDLTEDNLLVPF